MKGCGYPPSLNCTIWTKKYKTIGTNFSCFYSRVDPALVISDLDLWQNTLNLVYSMAIPIPSFIISVIYLTVAYFKIYNEDEEQAPLDKNAEEIADDDELGGGGGGASNGGGGSGDVATSCSVECCDQEDLGELRELNGVDGLMDDLGIELGDDEVCIVLDNGDGCGLSAGGSLPEGLIILPVDNGSQQSNSGPLPTTNSTDLPSSFRAPLIDAGSSRGSTENGGMSNSGSMTG